MQILKNTLNWLLHVVPSFENGLLGCWIEELNYDCLHALLHISPSLSLPFPRLHQHQGKSLAQISLTLRIVLDQWVSMLEHLSNDIFKYISTLGYMCPTSDLWVKGLPLAQKSVAYSTSFASGKTVFKLSSISSSSFCCS